MLPGALSRRTALAAIAALTLPLRSALAAYPDQPIVWIVAYAAGGGTDTLARLLGEAMGPSLGQPFVVENKPGGATNIGAAAAAQAEPDGYTVFTADNGTLVFNPALFRELPYDPAKDFRPVGLMARFPLLLAVRLDSVSTDVTGLIERARNEPGSIDYASPGIGSPHHLAMARLARESGIEVNHVPYKGAAPALNDLVGGHIELMMVDYPSAAGQIKAGKIRPLAATTADRIPQLPDLPTIREALGLASYQASAWQGMVVPTGTPDPVVARLSAAIASALEEPKVRDRMEAIGLQPLTGGPAEMQALIDEERSVWVPLIKELGITLD
ncbi:MAG: Bug family tripartite tricarboxylate transporter substrate binding protein [Geminicoccaceae bacterium]